jgi:hypothetical protein
MDTGARLTTFTRLGFASRGLIYIVIAFLVIGTGRAQTPGGALQYLGQGGGRILLAVMAAGLLAYSLWRLSDAVFDIEQHGGKPEGVMERVGAAASGAVHLFLAWQAVRVIQGSASASDGTTEGARSAMQLPGGDAFVLLAGAVLLGVGGYQLIKAAKGAYLRHLEPRIASQAWARWSGFAGYAARGIIFLISSYFLFKAGFEGQASEAGGTAKALSWLSSPWDILVALGLFGFGLFSIIEARFRRLHSVPVEKAIHRAAGSLKS